MLIKDEIEKDLHDLKFWSNLHPHLLPLHLHAEDKHCTQPEKTKAEGRRSTLSDQLIEYLAQSRGHL